MPLAVSVAPYTQVRLLGIRIFNADSRLRPIDRPLELCLHGESHACDSAADRFLARMIGCARSGANNGFRWFLQDDDSRTLTCYSPDRIDRGQFFQDSFSTNL